MKKLRLFTVAVSVLFISFCSRREYVASERPLLFVSIPPQAYFLEKICANRYDVQVLLPPGASPHSFEPKPSQMALIAKAKIYFAVGVEMESAWLPRIAQLNPGIMIVRTDSGIPKINSVPPVAHIHDETAHNDSHLLTDESHDAEDHDHEGADPHIWLSPRLVKLQARTMVRALAQMDTAGDSIYRERLAVFERELDTLHHRISNRLEECNSKKTFLTFHPSWAYFAEEFSLRQISVEVEGKEPGLRELAGVVNIAKQNGIFIVLVQPQFSRRVAEVLSRDLGGGTSVADPLARDWSDNLLAVTEVLCTGSQGEH